MTEVGKTQRSARWGICHGLCLLGLTLSSYLFLAEWFERRVFCFGSSACVNLGFRPESSIWGVPIAFIGVLYFAARGVGYASQASEFVRRTSGFGMVAALLLSLQLSTRLGYTCWPCTVVHLVAVLEFALLHGFSRSSERSANPGFARLLPALIALAVSGLALGVSPRLTSYADRVEMPNMTPNNAASMVLGNGGTRYTVYCRADCSGCEDLFKRAKRALARPATPLETALGQERPKFELHIRFVTLRQPTDEDARKIATVMGQSGANLEEIKAGVRQNRKQPLDITPTFFDEDGNLVANGRFYARHAVD